MRFRVRRAGRHPSALPAAGIGMTRRNGLQPHQAGSRRTSRGNPAGAPQALGVRHVRQPALNSGMPVATKCSVGGTRPAGAFELLAYRPERTSSGRETRYSPAIPRPAGGMRDARIPVGRNTKRPTDVLFSCNSTACRGMGAAESYGGKGVGWLASVALVGV